MKRLSMFLVVLFTAASVFAGGKYCEQKAAAAKSVELNGTMARADAGHKAVFHVANSDRSYTVCEKTSNAVLKLADGKSSVHVKGKVVTCGDKEELLIEQANKM
jgi:hypothetical protein